MDGTQYPATKTDEMVNENLTSTTISIRRRSGFESLKEFGVGTIYLLVIVVLAYQHQYLTTTKTPSYGKCLSRSSLFITNAEHAMLVTYIRQYCNFAMVNLRKSFLFAHDNIVGRKVWPRNTLSQPLGAITKAT